MSLIRRYPNPVPADLTQLLAATVERVPDRTAFIDATGAVTWQEFGQLVAAGAVQLAEHEVREGDRVAVLADNGIPFTVLAWALWRVGALLVPLNHRLTAADLAAQLSDAGVTLLAAGTSRQALARAASLAQTGAGPAAVLLEQSGWPGFFPDPAEGSENASRTSAAPAPLAGRPAAVLYTSGTTGKPKGVVVSHDNVLQNSITCTDIIGRSADTVELIMVPQFNVTGLCSQTVPVVSLGATAVLLPRFDEDRVVQLIREHGVTSTVGPPTMWWRMLAAAGADGLPSLRRTLSGGAPIPLELLRELARSCPNATFGNGYGLTETCSMVTYLDGAREPGHRDSIGVPLPVTDIKLLPVAGAADGVGELAVRGPQIAMGYWQDGQIRPLVDADGWLPTGDAVRLDDGFLVLVGRLKDVIKRGGESIFAVEIEETLMQQPDVAEAALVGVPDPVWGQLALAVLVPRPDRTPTEAEVLQFCRQRLAPYKIPAFVRFAAQLPRNAGGKVSKDVLAALFLPPSVVADDPITLTGKVIS